MGTFIIQELANGDFGGSKCAGRGVREIKFSYFPPAKTKNVFFFIGQYIFRTKLRIKYV